ncbi:UNVERIFIED_CONTAM: hypothetical protein HDU68_009800 [Siphonaria sp. JEL0065]|nr:hypothetical protein HDU68_009800 [Siphonaria sp. JEL0065]
MDPPPVVQEETKGLTAKIRKDLKAKNANPVRPNQDETKKLDGSLKKTSGFKAKIKTNLSSENVESLKKEILGLKLEKYLEEIVGAILDSKFAKPSDIWAAVDICSLLHQRFAEFADLMVPAVIKQFQFTTANKDASSEQKEREETARITKQRTILRLFTEFYLVGLVDACTVLPKKENAMVAVVTKMFNASTDKEFVNLPIAVVFCKTYENLILADKGLTEESLVADNIRISIKQTLSDYYQAASRHLVKMHKFIKKAEVSNYEHAVARGEVSEERQERFQRAQKVYEKFLANTQSISQNLGLEMPDLPEPESATGKLNIGISYTGSKEVDDQEALLGGPWEDEESRSFYEDLIDLKDVVPSILLGEKHEKPDAPTAAELEKLNSEMDKVAAEDQNTTIETEDDAVMEEPTVEAEPEEVDEEEKSKDAFNNARQQRETWFETLPNALSTDTIDKLAVEFCYINTKGTRKRLVTELSTVPRQRLDILPYYSRLIATLNPYIPEIAIAVIAALEKQFHFHQKKTDRTFVEEKVKVVRFIGELTKFKVPPYHVIFHFFKVLLESFSNHNIEAVCSMLETCGRFLYKTPETSRVASNVLDIMMKKRTAMNLDSRLILLIDNAFYVCNPPEKTAIQHKQRSPLELYIRKLFYTSELSKKNSERILKQLRKLNWSDPETLVLIRKPFFKCWKVKFSNLHVLAFLAFELSRYYLEFGVSIVDQCLEEVRVGLEMNLFKHNQRRVSTVRFLGEMYNYRLIDSGVVFDTLYVLLRFGYENQFPEPGVFCSLDAPHDFFRVRLCCVLLETCGQCFDRGILAQKLDEFLAFLQVYLHSKPRLSMDVEFLMEELFDLLRPKQILCKSYDEAVDAFNLLVMKHITQDPASVQAANAFTERFVENSDEEEDEWGVAPANAHAGSGDEEDAEVDEEQQQANASQEEDENEEEVVVHMPEQEVDAEFEVEFDKEFSKMMQDSLESRKFEKKAQAVFDVAIPVKRGVVFQQADSGPPEGVVFSFLTKKGNKPQMKAVELPQDSSFVVKTKQVKEAELEEKKQLKKLVLSYDDRADDDENNAAAPQKPVGKGKKQVLYSNDRQKQHRPNVIPKSLFE